MARIRSFKPEAPQHRKVGRLSIWGRWLWFVLVTQADDEGRLVADPGQLRLTAFGYDHKVTDGKVMVLLEEIQATGLIRLYAVEGVPYADFPSWRDHQRIDHPSKSKLPEYRDSTNPREASRILANIPGGSEGIGSDQIGRDRIKEAREASASWPSAEALVDLYNTKAPNECPEVTKITPGRRRKIREYLAAFPEQAFWEEICAQIRASQFLRGLHAPSPGRRKAFVATFDWLLSKADNGVENCVKVYEGNYHD